MNSQDDCSTRNPLFVEQAGEPVAWTVPQEIHSLWNRPETGRRACCLDCSTRNQIFVEQAGEPVAWTVPQEIHSLWNRPESLLLADANKASE
ncbi:MAG: hypothetical protein EAZ09_20495 [Oscillatoriales cyanobacterium]|nr:MAG: hypothetical protein EAZ09_20495 [Oscillatoriales cyanobacterium]